jgi:hypothetical protein
MALRTAAIIPPSVTELRIELDRRRAQRSFAEFVKIAWHVLEPETPLIWNWHLLARACRSARSPRSAATA